MYKTKRTAVRLAGIAAALFVFAAPAAAQWSVGTYGVAEWDTEETLLLLAGISASPGGPGWHPSIGLQASHLRFGQATKTTVTSIRPSVGLRYGFPGGSFGFRVGYAFVNRDKDDPSIPGGTQVVDSKDGVVLGAGLDYWGTGGPLGYQLLGSYSVESQSLWTRGRVTWPLGASAMRIGGEVAYLNAPCDDDLTPGCEDYRFVAPGGVLEFHSGGGFVLGFGVGQKFVTGGEDATYFRVEAFLPIGR